MLTVLSVSVQGKRGGKTRCIARCDCGAEREYTISNLFCGDSKSCGCSKMEILKKANVTHGLSKTTECNIWNGMKKRCYNPQCKSFPMYGGSGVSVCPRWINGDGETTGFECFLSDMGTRPTPRHSIDRYPDKNGNYEPGNCRWATPSEQSRNTKRTVLDREMVFTMKTIHREQGLGARSLSKMFGVKHTCVENVIYGRSWKDI